MHSVSKSWTRCCRSPLLRNVSSKTSPVCAFPCASMFPSVPCFPIFSPVFQSDVARYGFHILGIDVEWRPHTWTDGTVAYSGAHRILGCGLRVVTCAAFTAVQAHTLGLQACSKSHLASVCTWLTY